MMVSSADVAKPMPFWRVAAVMIIFTVIVMLAVRDSGSPHDGEDRRAAPAKQRTDAQRAAERLRAAERAPARRSGTGGSP